MPRFETFDKIWEICNKIAKKTRVPCEAFKEWSEVILLHFSFTHTHTQTLWGWGEGHLVAVLHECEVVQRRDEVLLLRVVHVRAVELPQQPRHDGSLHQGGVQRLWVLGQVGGTALSSPGQDDPRPQKEDPPWGFWGNAKKIDPPQTMKNAPKMGIFFGIWHFLPIFHV